MVVPFCYLFLCHELSLVDFLFFLLAFVKAGLIERSLKVPQPRGIIVIELLMSVKPDGCFALAKPVRW